jgi:glycosyltransferase involved in cell wall biosynthesis
MNILMTLANPFTHDPRVYHEAKSLVNEGHKVTILAWDKTGNHPKNEIKDGISIIRSYNTKFMNILPYDILRLHFWWKIGFKDALRIFEHISFDAVHCHDFSSLLIGVKLKKKLGVKLVYDAHELWSFMVSRDLPKIWANYYLWKEKILVKYVNQIITVNEPLQDYFQRITDKAVTIIMNAKNIQSRKYESPKNNIFTLIYIGFIGKSRYLLELVEVAKNIDDIHCIIAGSGSKKDYVDKVKKNCSKTDNVDFIGIVPMEKVIQMTKEANVVICMFDPDDKNSKIGLPNKVFESMITGRPIIVTNDVYLGKFVENENIGLSIPYDKKCLEEAIIKLKNDRDFCEKLGQNALQAAIKEYNWDVQEKKLLNIYEA